MPVLWAYVHFGNNRLQTELLEDIRELLGESRGYRLQGERYNLDRNRWRCFV